MPEPEDPFRRLPAAERERVRRFAERVERVPIEALLSLAAEPLDTVAHGNAVERAAIASGDSLRMAAVERVRLDAVAWVDRAFGRATLDPGRWELALGPPGSARDRARLARFLAEALTALVLWDRLDEADRDELLGPFAVLLDGGAERG